MRRQNMDLFGTKSSDPIEEFYQRPFRDNRSRNDGSADASLVTEQGNGRSKSRPTPAEECSNVISAGSRWEGRLKIEGSVRVEGQLAGEIESTETVHIAEGADVDAKVAADYVVIAGTFRGEIICQERLELMSTSRIFGELIAKSITVQEGAFIEGQLHMLTEGQVDSAGSPSKPKETKRSSE